MAKLTDLLGDVYGDDGDDDETNAATPDPTEPTEPPGPPGPTNETSPVDDDAPGTPTDEHGSADEPADAGGESSPEWASEDRLDAAFDDWTAGELPGHDKDPRESLEEPAVESAEGSGTSPAVRAMAAGELATPRPPQPTVTPPGTVGGHDGPEVQMTDLSGGGGPEVDHLYDDTDDEPDDDPTTSTGAPTPGVQAWTPSDDDILPKRRGGLGGLLGGLRR